MSKLKHTQGPWTFDMTTIWTDEKVDGAYREIAEMSEGSNNDGRLMAAAPELLEACQLALGAFSTIPNEKTVTLVVEHLFAAIAKAEGTKK